jgi:flagellar FliL protein
MAEKESEKSAGDNSQPEAKKGKGRMIIIIVVVVVLLGGAGGGFYYWRSTSVAAAENAKNKKSQSKSETGESKPPVEKDESDKKSAKKTADALENAIPDDQEVKKIVELPPFIVNLADTEQSRYLRMTISLGVSEAEKAGEKSDPLFMARVRNAMLAVVSDKKSDEILSVEGKNKLRKELLKAAKAASSDPEVVAIYITDFIVQL